MQYPELLHDICDARNAPQNASDEMIARDLNAWHSGHEDGGLDA